MDNQPVDQRINIAVVCSTLQVGGAEQLLKELLLNLNQEEFHLKLMFLKTPGPIGDELIQRGLEAEDSILKGGKYNPLNLIHLTKRLKKFNPHLIFQINHLDALIFATISAKLLGLPTINWHNETYKPYRFHAITMICRSILQNMATTIVAAANGHKQYLIQHEKVQEEKIIVIHNGVDPARAQSKLSQTEARTLYHLPEKGKIIAQIAALRPDKAHKTMLEALEILIQQVPEAFLILTGEGSERVNIEHLIRKKRLKDHCCLLGKQKEIGDVIATADVVALSSNPKQETLSVAAIEAMFAGKPVISTRVGFMDEIVLDQQTGLLVPHNDPAALAEAFMTLFSDPNKRKEMGQKGRQHIATLCHISAMTTGFERLFRKTAQANQSHN